MKKDHCKSYSKTCDMRVFLAAASLYLGGWLKFKIGTLGLQLYLNVKKHNIVSKVCVCVCVGGVLLRPCGLDFITATQVASYYFRNDEAGN